MKHDGLVTVVIPSYDRKDALRRCITHVLSQDYIPFEVVVVHQGSGALPRRDPRVRVLHYQKPLGSPGAKNVGIEAAQGDQIVFLDDDAYPQSNQWLSQLIEPFSFDHSLGAVGGRIVETDRTLGDQPSVGRIVFNSLGMYKIIGNFGSLETLDVDHLSSGNLALSREALRRVQPPYFDPDFRGSAFREEVDLCLRLKSLGFKLKHIGNATVIHQPAAYGGNRRRGHLGGFWNGYGEATLFLKAFYKGKVSDVTRFLLQEALFNWMPPLIQISKLVGVLFSLATWKPTAEGSQRRAPQT